MWPRCRRSCTNSRCTRQRPAWCHQNLQRCKKKAAAVAAAATTAAQSAALATARSCRCIFWECCGGFVFQGGFSPFTSNTALVCCAVLRAPMPPPSSSPTHMLCCVHSTTHVMYITRSRCVWGRCRAPNTRVTTHKTDTHTHTHKIKIRTR